MAKPNCYGDSDYYAETSRICNNCGYRADCKAQVNKDINRNWSTPSTSSYDKKKHTNGSIGPIMPSVAGGLTIGSSVYNHSNSLAPQFMRYLGYSVAEATIEEAKVLVQSMRHNYTQEQIKQVQPIIALADTEKDKENK